MNFLKISGLVIGTSSVVGGTGAGIYYVAIKKIEFDGKLVFEKKTDGNYVIKLLTTQQYTYKAKEFNKDKNDSNTKYEAVNKVIDISYELNVSKAESKLKEIFGDNISLEDAKKKVSTEKEKDLKELFGEKIYDTLKTKLES